MQTKLQLQLGNPLKLSRIWSRGGNSFLHLPPSSVRLQWSEWVRLIRIIFCVRNRMCWFRTQYMLGNWRELGYNCCEICNFLLFYFSSHRITNWTSRCFQHILFCYSWQIWIIQYIICICYVGNKLYSKSWNGRPDKTDIQICIDFIVELFLKVLN